MSQASAQFDPPPALRTWPLAGLVVLGLAVAFAATGLVLVLGVALLPEWHAAGLALAEQAVALLPFDVQSEAALALVLNKAALICVAILPVMALEAALGGWQYSSFARLARRSTSSSYDLLIFALNLLGIWKFIVQLFTLGGMIVVGALTAMLVAEVAQAGVRFRTGHVALDVALAFLVFTLADYASHRMFHTRAFWPLHRMHHSATEMTALTLWRNHPVAPAIEAFFKVVPFLLFDVPAAAVAVIGLIVLIYLHLIHSNIGWHWGWFGRWVLLPPSAHRIHHSTDPALYGRNLGIPVIWDRLFGTFTDPRLGTLDMPVGVTDVPTNTGRPHMEAWADLKEWVGGLRPRR